MPTEAELAAQKAEQDKKDAETAKLKAEADAKAIADAKAKEDNKVGNIFKKKEGGKVVPEAVFLEQKKALKEALEENQKLKDSGASKKEVSQSLKDIAEEFDVDEQLIEKLAGAIKSDTDAKIDEKIKAGLKPIEDKEAAEDTDKRFKAEYARVMAQMPDGFKDVVKEAVIKSLTLNPENKDKTFEDVIRETYGHLVKGTKKPIEKTRPKDGGAQDDIDYDRAKGDQEYFKEIMADPTRRAEYNKNIHKRLQL